MFFDINVLKVRCVFFKINMDEILEVMRVFMNESKERIV